MSWIKRDGFNVWKDDDKKKQNYREFRRSYPVGSEEKMSKEWKKSFTASADMGGLFDNIFKLVLYGGILVGGYLVFTSLFDRLTKGGTGATCPPGTHSEFRCDSLTGLPKILCGLGGWGTGGVLDCVPDGGADPVVPPTVCAVGAAERCVADGGYFEPYPSCTCDLTKPPVCLDVIGMWACKLAGKVWNKDGSCKCEDNPPDPVDACTLGTNKCENGIVWDCVTKLDYYTGKIVNTWAVTPISCASPVDPVVPDPVVPPKTSDIQRCPDGTLVDLLNPPGITLGEACAGSGPRTITNQFYGDCIRALMSGPCIGSLWTSPGCVAAALACETDTSRNFLGNPTEVSNFISGCTGTVRCLRPEVQDAIDRYGWSVMGTIQKGYDGGVFPGCGTLVCTRP